MLNKLAITTSDSLYAIGTKAFLTVDGIHRKAKKIFRTTNGIHRLCYQFGIEWNKYSCNVSVSDDYYREYPENSEFGDDNVTLVYASKTYDYIPAYDFSISKGYYEDRSSVSSVTGDSLMGSYHVTPTGVWEYTSINSQDGDTIHWNLTPVARADYFPSETTYSKGDTVYGNIYAEEDVLPENGILVDGDISGGYCVLKINDECFYYEKV